MSRTHARYRLAAGTIGIALLASACTMKKTETPGLTGPSELSTSITITVSPDQVAQDGASQSLVSITARDNNAQPIRNLALRAEIAVIDPSTGNGVITDFGTLSQRSVVTDSAGHASLVYTAPPAPAGPAPATLVVIRVTPLGTDYANATSRQVSINVVPPGVVVPPSTGLTAKFTFTPATPSDHQVVLFDASGSAATGASIVTYQWNFGDGATASGVTAQHTYNSGGSFVVTLTVTDSIGRTNSSSQTVTVGTVTIGAPNITVSPTSPNAGQQVFFTSTTTLASNGRRIVAYDWTFGDGTTGSGQSTSHVYATAGTYTVILAVTDDQGHIATATSSITVATGNPTADFSFSPSAPHVGNNITFDASTSQPATGRTIVSYNWVFDDGSTGTGKTVTHAYGAAGTFNVRLTVTDDQGRTGVVTKPVTVVP
ncbi:MAG TPA: PKD domain-containing protein [Vicinamibacterales bacterium]|jgi:PKD repeat protein|nr:PKD domain-containing protein [Vicinamibacterales bacterium]